MSSELPRLQSDLSVNRWERAGTVQFELSAPGCQSTRVSGRVFQAIQAIGVSPNFDTWCSTVTAADPGIDRRQLTGLAQRLVDLGLATAAGFQQPAPTVAEEFDTAVPLPDDDRTAVGAMNPFEEEQQPQPPSAMASSTPGTALPDLDIPTASLPAVAEQPTMQVPAEALHAAQAAEPPAYAEPAPEEEEQPAGEGVEYDENDRSAVWDDAEAEVMEDPAVRSRVRKRRLLFVAKVLALPIALSIGAAFVPYPLKVTYPCEVQPLEQDIIRAPRAGVVAKVLVEEGQAVKAGDVLGELANAGFRTAMVKTSAQLERAKAELQLLQQGSRPEEVDRAKASVNGLYREVLGAKKSVKRLRKLVRDGVAPRGQLEEAQARLAGLQGGLSKASADLNLAQAGSRPDEVRQKEAVIRGVEAQLKLDEEVLEGTVLRASMDGVLTTRRPQELLRTRVSAGDEVFEVATLEKMRAVVFVDERDFDVVKPGLSVSLKVASHPTESFAGEVQHVAPKVEKVDDRNIVRVEAEVTNRGGLLIPNMTGFAEVTAGERSVAYLVVRRLLRWVRVRFLI